MFKQQLMNTREAYDSCNLRLKTEIDRLGLSYYSFTHAIEQYRETYADQGEEVELCLFVTLTETSRLATDSQFQALYDPATQLDILQKGFLGKIVGVSVYFLNPDSTFTERRPQLLGRRALSDSELIERIKDIVELQAGNREGIADLIPELESKLETKAKPVSVITSRNKDGSVSALLVDSKEEIKAMLHTVEMLERNAEKFSDLETFKTEIVRIRDSLEIQIKENF
jgi:hypothetical protein